MSAQKQPQVFFWMFLLFGLPLKLSVSQDLDHLIDGQALCHTTWTFRSNFQVARIEKVNDALALVR
jgi:hypothetical protein